MTRAGRRGRLSSRWPDLGIREGPGLDRLALLSPEAIKARTFETLQRMARQGSHHRPIVFVVEDLHWMDPSTLEFLSLLIDQVPMAQLLLVLTCRPAFHLPWGFRAHLIPITLDRLSPSQAHILVQRVAAKSLPPTVQQHLVAHTDGVPLFIEELTKMVLESGRLQAHADQSGVSSRPNSRPPSGAMCASVQCRPCSKCQTIRFRRRSSSCVAKSG